MIAKTFVLGERREGGGGRSENEKGLPSRNLFLSHSEDFPSNCYSVLTTPVEPGVQVEPMQGCWEWTAW